MAHHHYHGNKLPNRLTVATKHNLIDKKHKAKGTTSAAHECYDLILVRMPCECPPNFVWVTRNTRKVD